MDRNKLLLYLWIGILVFLIIGFVFFKGFMGLLWKSMFSFNGLILLFTRIFSFLIISRILYIVILFFLIYWIYKSLKSKS